MSKIIMNDFMALLTFVPSRYVGRTSAWYYRGAEITTSPKIILCKGSRHPHNIAPPLLEISFFL